MQYRMILIAFFLTFVWSSEHGYDGSRGEASEYNADLSLSFSREQTDYKESDDGYGYDGYQPYDPPQNTNKLWPMVAVTIDGSNFKSADNIVCDTAYEILIQTKSTLSAIVAGASLCEEICDGVGWGETPDAIGETTLDAMLMYGPTRKAGCVGQLRNIKNAMGVARAILIYTKHTIMVGESAMEFAVKMGFPLEDLTSIKSNQIHGSWLHNNCQPNFWQNVQNVEHQCEPYIPLEMSDKEFELQEIAFLMSNNNENMDKFEGLVDGNTHDTISLIALDEYGIMSAGTTTSGLTHKIHGRVGDSPIPGGGSYVIQDVGACGANGNGDIMVRFLPSYKAVIHMANGETPYDAIQLAMQEIRSVHPFFSGSMICVAADGTHASGSSNPKLPKLYMVRTPQMHQAEIWTCEYGGYCHQI